MRTKLMILILGVLFCSSLWAQVSSSDTDFLYARKLYDDKLYGLAAQEFSKFVKNYPSDSRLPDARYFSGMANFNDKNYENARRDFQFLAIDFPKDKRAPDAWQKVAECYAAMGDYAGAANSLTTIGTFYPGSPNAVSSILLASDYFIKAGDLKNAKDRLQKLIADQPDIPEAQQSRLKLAILLKNEKSYVQASIEFQNVVDKAKDPEMVAQAIFEKAGISELHGRSDEARNAYNKIISRYGKTRMNAYAQFEVGLILIREKKFTDARKMFESVVGTPILPLSVKNAAQINIGDTYFMTGQYVQAADSYKKIAEDESDSLNALEAVFKWGVVLEKLNRLDGANERYFTIINTWGEKSGGALYLPLAYLKVAQNFTELKKYREASSYYDLFAKRYPDYSALDRVLLRRGTLLQNQLSDYAEAAIVYEDLADKYPKNIQADQIRYNLAQVYRKDSRIKEALDILRQFKNDFPGSSILDVVNTELNYIVTYYPEGNNKTTERIVYLLGDLIAEKPKDEMLFSYATLFFQELKDYKGAAELFRSVMAVTKNKQLIEEAAYYTALSFDRLSRKSSELAMYGDSALEMYKKLTVGKYADEATLYIVESNLQKMSQADDRARKSKEAYTAVLERYPSTPFRDKILMGLGRALWDLREVSLPADNDKKAAQSKKTDKSAKDSKAGPRKFVSAIECFDEIIRAFPSGQYADDAYFNNILCYAYLTNRAEYFKAMNAYITAFPRGKHVAQVKFMMAKYKEDQNEYQPAILAYNELINQYYYTSYADSAIQGIGNNYLYAQQYDKAIQAFLNSVKLNKDEFSDLDISISPSAIHQTSDYKIAYAYEKLNNQTRAIEYYESYLYPDNGGQYAQQALQTLARLYDQKQDYRNAIRFYRTLADKFAKTDAGYQGLNRVAEIHFTAEQYDSARTAYLKLSEWSTDKLQQIIFDSRIIVCAYRLGQINATSALEKEFSKKYDSEKNLKALHQNYKAEFLYELGRYYQYQGARANYELAFKTYTRVLDDYKNSAIAAEVMYEMGVIRFNEGKSKEGFELLQQIPQKYPNSEILSKVYLRLANEAFRLEQPQMAMEAAKMALQNPYIKMADAKYGTDFLIKVYKAAGYYENALLLIQQYLEKFPDDEPANIFSKRIDIGVMFKNLKSYNRSLEYFKELIRIASGEDEAEIQYNIAETYWAMGNFEQALLEYLRIPYLTLGKKFDWASAAKSQAAECYVKLSKYNEAVRLYEDIIRTNGAGSEYGIYAKQRIEQIRAMQKVN
ncbi:tetratricopeptide repeat protein [bacterium]|nr:tetratricopeptide repeat protein [bacterium]